MSKDLLDLWNAGSLDRWIAGTLDGWIAGSPLDGRSFRPEATHDREGSVCLSHAFPCVYFCGVVFCILYPNSNSDSNL